MDWGQEMRCKENAATSQKLTALIAVTAVRDGLYRAGLATNEDLKAHCRSTRFSGAGDSCAHSQRGTVSLVPREWPSRRSAHDFDDGRAL
jgi:hypothetical protein